MEPENMSQMGIRQPPGSCVLQPVSVGGETGEMKQEQFMESVPVYPGKKSFSGRRGDPTQAPRCGARTRRGGRCRRAAERNPRTGRRLRCRLHGGLSTGAKTEKGKKRSAAAPLRHGRYTKAYNAVKAILSEKLEAIRSGATKVKTT
jgi:hypothetical protein